MKEQWSSSPLLFLNSHVKGREYEQKIMQHVFTLIVLLSLGSAVFLGYKLVQKERDYQKGQESLERVYQVMEEVRVQQDGSSPSGSLSSPEEEVKVRELRREQYAVLNQEIRICRDGSTSKERR